MNDNANITIATATGCDALSNLQNGRYGDIPPIRADRINAFAIFISLRYDIEFCSVSPYNVLTGTAMPSKMKGDKSLQLLPHIDGFHQSGKTIPKHFLNKAIENMDSDNNSNANAHYVNY